MIESGEAHPLFEALIVAPIPHPRRSGRPSRCGRPAHANIDVILARHEPFPSAPEIHGRLYARTPERWFDTSAFAIARPFAFGSAGRNIVTGPGYINLDVGLSRRFRLTERVNLTLDAQAFNLSNTAHFDMPERYADEPALFGRILSAKAPRQIQFGLRLGF